MPTINQLVRKGREKLIKEDLDASTEKLPSEKGCMCQGVYHHAQETEFSVA